MMFKSTLLLILLCFLTSQYIQCQQFHDDVDKGINEDESGSGSDEDNGEKEGENFIVINDAEPFSHERSTGSDDDEDEKEVIFNSDNAEPEQRSKNEYYSEEDDGSVDLKTINDQNLEVEKIGSDKERNTISEENLKSPLSTVTTDDESSLDGETESESGAMISENEKQFQEKFNKIKLIPSSKLNDDEESSKTVENIHNHLAIKFIVKPRTTHLLFSNESAELLNEGSADSASGNNEEGPKARKYPHRKEEKAKARYGINTYIINENSDSSGSGETEEESDSDASGSGNQSDDAKVLTYALRAIVHPLRIKNESKFAGTTVNDNGNIESMKRDRRNIQRHIERKEKKGFVPPSEMYIPEKDEVQGPDQIENLFYTSLHADFHSRPEFGSRSDPWNEGDIQELASMAGNGIDETKGGPKTEPASSRQMLEQVPGPSNPNIAAAMYQQQRIQTGAVRQQRPNIGEPVRQGEEGRVMAANFREISHSLGEEQPEDIPQDEVTMAEHDIGNVGNFRQPYGKEMHQSFIDNGELHHHNGGAHFNHIASQAKYPMNDQQKIPPQSHATSIVDTELTAPIAAAPESQQQQPDTKIAAAKESKNEMATAEAKYEAMETARIQQELMMRRKGSFGENDQGMPTEQEQAAVRSYFRNYMKSRKHSRQ